MRKLHTVGLFYCCLIAIFTPFTFHFIQIQTPITDLLFGALTKWMANAMELTIDPQENFTSDSVQLYLLYLVLAPISILLVALASCLKFIQQNPHRMMGVLTSFLIYYLALICFKYGLDKLNGQQFPFPEPNLLFTPLGYLDKDILYWSSMGSSPRYIYFLGLIELLVGILLLIRKTRFLGILLAAITFTQVVAINFGFDISVKLFSTYLCITSLLLLFPIAKEISTSMQLQKPLSFNVYKFKTDAKYYSIKCVAIVFLLMESIYPAYQSFRQNNVKPSEENMYGAYEVLNRPNSTGIKRIFIHKDNYFIVQTNDDNFIDYRLQWSTQEDAIYAKDYDNHNLKIPFRWVDNRILVFKIDTLELQTSPISIKDLPLKQPLFHLTVD